MIDIIKIKNRILKEGNGGSIEWKFLCSFLVFVTITTTSSVALSQLASGLNYFIAFFCIILGIISIFYTWNNSEAPKDKFSRFKLILFIFFALISLRAFLWVIYSHDNEIRILSPHNLGDISLHLNLINRWALGGDFWPENPFMSGAIFPYHPGMDFFNSIITMLGVPVFVGLKVIGFIGAIATAVSLWVWGRWFAIFAFLFSGGISGIFILFGTPYNIVESDVEWKNIFLSMFVTQRSLLYALPAGLVLISTWRSQLNKDSNGPKISLPIQVLLYSTMPLFNAPAFLFLSVLLAIFFLADWYKNNSNLFLKIGLLSIIPASWLVNMVTVNFSANSAFRFSPGWTMGSDGFWFWFWNFGLILPLFILLGFFIFSKKNKDPASKFFYITSIGTLIFCFLFAIAPWAWDNNKLMIWGYLILMALVWQKMICKWPKFLQFIVCITLFLSGAVNLILGLDTRHGYGLANKIEYEEIKNILNNISINERVAVFPTYNHPALLAGQPVVMGYDGHLFSQGLDYTDVYNNLQKLMSGEGDWKEAANFLNVKYILWGKREYYKWPKSTKPWITCATIVAESKNAGELYNIEPCFNK